MLLTLIIKPLTINLTHKLLNLHKNIIAIFFFHNNTLLLAKIVEYNKCFPSFFYLDYLYKIFAFIYIYKPVIFNYVNTLGFIHSLHISLNILYNFMYSYINIWKWVFILHIIGYTCLPLYASVSVSQFLLGSLLIYYCILFWNNFVYKAYINDKFWLFTFCFIIFLILFFLATTLIVSGTSFLYKVLTQPKGKRRKHGKPSSNVGGSGQGPGSPGNSNPGQSSGGFKGAGHDPREKPKDDNPGWDLGSTSEPDAENVAKIESTDSIEVQLAKAQYLEYHKQVQRNKQAFEREHNQYQVRSYNHGMDSPLAKEAKDKYEKADKLIIKGRIYRTESANEIKQILRDENSSV